MGRPFPSRGLPGRRARPSPGGPGPRGKDRWNAWRPNVALAMQEDLHFDEFHLLYQSQFQGLCDSVVRDIRTASPDTEVIPEIIEFDDPWDFGEVYGKLYDYALARRFDREERDWYVHITTGSHVAQICLFLLNESHHLPGKLVQTAPSRTEGPRGTYRVIDLELSRYDALARRFATERRDDITSLKGGIETRNAAFNALIETVERVAVRSRDPILLTGPTGADAVPRVGARPRHAVARELPRVQRVRDAPRHARRRRKSDEGGRRGGNQESRGRD